MRIVERFALVAWLLAMPACAAHAAATCDVRSGALTRPLVELYTSEGCDSCPPADRWLSATFAPAGPAIALAFHVDYWDRLGWTDRFASAAYTERQHRAADANGASFVYTPQALLQGHDLRWRDAGAQARIAAAAAVAPRASIEVHAQRNGTSVAVRARAEVRDPALRRGAFLALAYVDSGLVSEVKAGENRGRRLVHDHVVRAWVASPSGGGTGDLAAEARFVVPVEAGRDARIVAFVQRSADADVLQAVDLALDDCSASAR
jgi:hypothetical protein